MLDTTKTLYWAKSVESFDTGGGCHVDFIHLHDGRVLAIDGELVALYDSMRDFYESDDFDREVINLAGGHAMRDVILCLALGAVLGAMLALAI